MGAVLDPPQLCWNHTNGLANGQIVLIALNTVKKPSTKSRWKWTPILRATTKMFQHRQQWKKKIAGLNGSVNAIGVAKEIENNEYMMYSLCVVVVKTLHRALHITCITLNSIYKSSWVDTTPCPQQKPVHLLSIIDSS